MAKSENSVGITKKQFRISLKFEKQWALGICVDFRGKSQQKSTFLNLLSLLQSVNTRWQQRVSRISRTRFRRLKLLASRKCRFCGTDDVDNDFFEITVDWRVILDIEKWRKSSKMTIFGNFSGKIGRKIRSILAGFIILAYNGRNGKIWRSQIWRLFGRSQDWHHPFLKTGQFSIHFWLVKSAKNGRIWSTCRPVNFSRIWHVFAPILQVDFSTNLWLNFAAWRNSAFPLYFSARFSKSALRGAAGLGKIALLVDFA